jgi:hypothetical protein
MSNTIINFKTFNSIFREDFLCGIVSEYYANMQNQNVKLMQTDLSGILFSF